MKYFTPSNVYKMASNISSVTNTLLHTSQSNCTHIQHNNNDNKPFTLIVKLYYFVSQNNDNKPFTLIVKLHSLPQTNSRRLSSAE